MSEQAVSAPSVPDLAADFLLSAPSHSAGSYGVHPPAPAWPRRPTPLSPPANRGDGPPDVDVRPRCHTDPHRYRSGAPPCGRQANYAAYTRCTAAWPAPSEAGGVGQRRRRGQPAETARCRLSHRVRTCPDPFMACVKRSTVFRYAMFSTKDRGCVSLPIQRRRYPRTVHVLANVTMLTLARATWVIRSGGPDGGRRRVGRLGCGRRP